ncbi:MAG: beta-galactosidase [Ignavibacteriaceae bacterium]|nr:beta-galactosidase [Ignavibacteriaceae bacterium]
MQKKYLICFNLIPLILLSLFGLTKISHCQEGYKFDTILYGASFYEEYMPYERLEEDVKLMEDAGITVVRLGESTWSSWEPEDGKFQFDWMDRIINRLHKAGIKVIFGTPTYSIPPWLYKKHPEILLTKINETKSYYGPRQNMDITNPDYLFYSERIIRKLLEHYKDHPAIIGWQIDNETSSYGTAGKNVQKAFVDYLKEKFKTVKELNKIWGLTYWGQLLHSWDEVPEFRDILNPGWKLEWERFQQKITTDFLAWQAKIVNEYKRADQFIVHNFVGSVRTNIDEFEIAKHLDITGVNPYHEVQEWLDGETIAVSGDLCRSLKQQNYLITETNAQTIGWDSKWQRPPYDGQIRLNVYSHIASGANLVAYWHWHSLHYGQETYWKGVLGHDLEPNRVYKEVSKTAHELKHIGSKLVNFKKENKVALLYSVDSYQGIRFMPFHDKVDYLSILYQMYNALYKLNVDVDFIFPQTTDYSKYKVIVVPPLYITDDAQLKRLTEFVKNGGHVLFTLKSGFCNEFSTVRWERMPAIIREAAGISYQEFSSLWDTVPLKDDPYKVGDKNKASVWAEFLNLEGAKPLAFYEHPFYGKYPAITRNQYGKGTLTYQGTVLTNELQQKVIKEIIDNAGLGGPEQLLPENVRLRQGISNKGKKMRYFLNFSSTVQKFNYAFKEGTEILTSRVVKTNQELEIQPWDLAIIEEQ